MPQKNISNLESPNRVERRVSKSRGVVRNVSVPSFLQMLSMEKRSCVVDIEDINNGNIGRVYFCEGELCNAEFGSMEALAAAEELVSWDSVEMRFRDELKERIEKCLHINLMTLLMGSMNKKDMFQSAELRLIKIEQQKSKELTKKEVSVVNVQKVNAIVDNLKNDLGSGLLATDIFTVSEGISIAGYGSQDAAVTLFNELTDFISNTLNGSGFPSLGRYYLLDLVDNHMVIIIPMGEYRMGIMVDSSKARMGLLVGIIIPKIIDAFEDALVG